MLSLRKTESDPEDLFARNYARLLRWSLQLTGGDRATAEDLLHDVFVLFTLRGPEVDAVTNLDAYLYTMLRNLHVSRLRRQTRARTEQFSVVEFDSAEAGLHALTAFDRVRVREELRRVCHYACARKERAKSACALILRFFHGYYPSEAARVLRTSRPAVDVRLREARAEARLFLESPERLGHLEELALETAQPSDFGRTDDLLQELRRTVFRSRRGECLTRKGLSELYDPASALLPTQAQLAHVVSCAVCLEEVNRLLGLAPLSERNPVDSADREPRGKGGDGGGAGGGLSPQKLKRLRRRAAETFEHKPRELCVSVNGYLRGAQRVTSVSSELDLVIDTNEPLSFVEILSEQDVRLLMLPLTAPPEGDGEQSAAVTLSDGRRLEISLRFRSPWPALRLLYHDPTFDFAAETAAEDATLPADAGTHEETGARDSSAHKQRLGPGAWLASLARRLFGRGGFGGFMLRPGPLTAALALILVMAILLMRTPETPGVNAADLLRRSAVAEEGASGGANTVMFRAVTLEETAGAGRAPTARRRIEVWKSAERGLTVRRLYDEHGRLLAGEWRGRDGASTVYRAAGARGGAGSPWDVDAAWQYDPSAADFDKLTASAADVRVEESADTYLLAYDSEGSGDGVASARLRIRRRDLHAVEQTLTVREAGSERRLRFAEVGYERKPKSSVPPSVFEPDALLLSPGSVRVERPAAIDDARAAVEAQAQGRSGAARGASTIATAALEVEVLGLLNRAGADLGEQVSVSRTPQGPLYVRAIVETDARKAELLRALAPVAMNPAVRVEMVTASEAARQSRQNPSAPEVIQEVAPAGNRVAADAELRLYFSERGGRGGEQLESEIIRFAVRESARSRRALQHAWALKRLAARFDARELAALDEGARLKWLSMIREHAEAVRREASALDAELRPVFSPAAAGVGGDTPIEEAGLAEAAGQLLSLCSEIDPAVRSAFAVSNGGASAAALKSPRFWRALRGAESLAGRIAQGARR
ncbi:MAG: RNA polymerase sigma factor [Pyrinomonadaceae bacterium]